MFKVFTQAPILPQPAESALHPQRRGMTTKPLAPGARRVISGCHPQCFLTQDPMSL